MTVIAAWVRFARQVRPLASDWRLAARMTVAALSAYVIAEYLLLPQSFWAVLTAVLVTQASLGGSLKAMSDRFFGTLSGGVWGVIVSLVVPHGDARTMGAALLLAIAPLSLLAAARPAYRVAPVTAVILLLGSAGNHVGPLTSALDRVLEIGLGCAVAMVISLSVLPARAYGLLAVATRDNLAALAALANILMRGFSGTLDAATVASLQQTLRTTLSAAETVAVEAVRERRTHLTEAPDPEPLLRTLRRLRHDLALVSRAMGDGLPDTVAQRIVTPATEVATAVTGFLEQAGDSFVARRLAPPTLPIRVALAHYEDAMTALRRDGTSRALSDLSAGRLFALAFALDQLAGDLEDLAARIAEYAR
jgi:uncharacterized membrane protein YccC